LAALARIFLIHPESALIYRSYRSIALALQHPAGAANQAKAANGGKITTSSVAGHS
jgi:hypothetical protein